MARARIRLLPLFLPLALLVVVSAPSADRTDRVETVSRDVDFASLDGSSEDGDGTADGRWTVPNDLVLEGRLVCGRDPDGTDDKEAGSDCAMAVRVEGDLLLQPGSGIEAGRGLTLEVAGDLLVREGSFLAADGALDLAATGQITIDGLVSASGIRRGERSRGRGDSRATVRIESTGGPGGGVRIGPAGTVLATGGAGQTNIQRPSGNRVELSGCGIEVLGLVASVGSGPGSGVVMRSCEGLVVDGTDLVDPNGLRRGRIEVQGAGASQIDLFAQNSVDLDGAELRVGGGSGDRGNSIAVTSDQGSLSWRRGLGEVELSGEIRLTACGGVELDGSRLAPQAEIVEACAGVPSRDPAPGLVSLPGAFLPVIFAEEPNPPAPACTPNLSVDNLTISTIEEFVSCNVLTSANTRIIPRGHVTYRTGESIGLENGFSVEGSSTFIAIIDPTLNQPPVIISDGGGATAAKSIPENTTAVTDVNSTDPEGDAEGAGLTYSLSGVDAAKFTIDMDSGVLDFVAPPDFEIPTDANMDNDYEVTVTVTDSGGSTDVQDITVTVTDVLDTGTIEIVKATLPAGGTGFGFTGNIGMANVFSLDDGQIQTFTAVVPGTYLVTEDDPTPAFDLTALTCVDPDGGTTTNLGTREATIDLDVGETVTCTFTNTKRGTIEIVKVTTPAGGTGFGFTGNIGMANVFSLDDGQTQTFLNVLPGSYLVTEDDPTPAFDLTTLTCVDPDAGTTTNAMTRAATIDLDPGESITCTFTNTERGSIEIVKNTIGGDGTFGFTDGAGTPLGGAFNLTTVAGTVSTTFTNIAPATIVVTEDDPTPAFDLTGLTCVDPDAGTTTNAGTRAATIDLDPGESIICTFTNTKRGSITIVKDTVGGDGTFGFTDGAGTPLGGAFNLTTVAGTKSTTFTNIVPGTIVVTEDDPTPGFDLTALACVDPDTGTTTNAMTRAATIDLDPGESIICTFTNTKRGSIEIVKNTVGGDGTFGFTDGAGNPLGGAFNLTTLAGTGSTTFSNLALGTYVVTEDDPTPGFDLTGLTCADPDTGSTTSLGTRAATIDVDAGESITCTFTNTKRGSISITKATIPAAGTGFGFTDDIAAPNSFSLDDGQTEIFTNVVPGTYSVTETTIPGGGWSLDSATCSDGSPVTAIDLGAGEAITCTFNNVQGGTIIIAKSTTPAAGTGFVFTQNMDASGNFTLDDGQNKTFTAVPAGTYAVSETPAAGWALSSATCSDGSPITAIDLSSAETITCTFNNVNAPPVGGPDSFDFVGNTLLLVDKSTSGAPEIVVSTTGGTTPAADGVLDNDTDPESGGLSVAGIFASMVNCSDTTAPFTNCPTVNDGRVTMEANGRFSYTPKAGDTMPTDMFGYKLSDDLNTADVVVTLTRKNRVWYVKNDNASGTDDGTSVDPFDTLAEAGTNSLAGDTIFVFEGDGMTTGQNGGITLKTMQRLLGEGVALAVPDTVNGVVGPTLFAAGNKPLVEHATALMDGITVDASAADHTGIEIRGLSISGARNAIDVTSAGTFVVGITITDNLIDNSGGEAIDLNPGASGDFNATVEDNTFSTSSPTGNAIDVVTTASAGDVELAINRNTDITSSSGTGIRVDGTAGGNLFVTGFADNTVHGNTGGTGISILGAVFDSDTSDVDFDEVDAGTTRVGSNVNPVGGSGMILGDPAAAANRVSGNLSFGQLDVYNSAGTGLGVAGSAVSMGGPPPTAGFQIGVTTGTVIAAGGPAVDFDPLTAGVTLAQVSSTSSPTTGISLRDVAGLITLNNGGSGSAISGSTGTAFEIDNGTATISYAGVIDNASGFDVEVKNRPGGAGNVTFSNTIGSSGATTGTGIPVTSNAAGAITFSGAVNLNTGSSGAVNLTSNTGATVNFTGGLDIDTTSGTGFNATGGGTVAVTGTNNIDSTTGRAMNMDGITIGASGMTFATIDKNAAGGAPVAIDLNNVDGGTFSVTGSSTIAGTAAGASNHGIDITGGAAATFTFASATIDSTGGAGINLSGANGAVTFTTVNIDGTSGAGIDIASNPNAVNVNGGSIGSSNDPAGNGVDVNGGSGNVTVAATITNQTNRAVEVTGRMAGTVTFSGAIDEDGTGINLNSNPGSTIAFSGGMALDTGANTAFSATGLGTVNVTGTNTIGATAALDATAVNIANTTIGMGGVTFQSISVDQSASGGDTSGINLDTTGSGTFTVTGDGTTTVGGNGSGGTIENITGADAIILESTGGLVTLQNMIVEDIAGATDAADPIQTRSFHDGIHGENVSGGLKLQSVTMRRFSDHAILGALFSDGTSFSNWNGLELHDSLFESANRFHVAGRGDDGDEGVIRVRGLTGSMVVDTCTVRLGGRGLDIYTPSGTGTLDATIQSNTFEDLYKEFPTGGTINVGGRGVSFTARGSHDMVVRVGDPAQTNPALGNTFTNNFTASLVVLGEEGGGAAHTGDVDTVISRNTFRVTDHSTSQATPPSFAFNFPQGGVSLNPSGGTFEGIVSNNLFDQVMHAAGGFGQLTIGHNTGGGASEFIVRGNEFRLPWDMAMQLRSEGNSSMAVLVEDNTWTDGIVGGPGTDIASFACFTGDPAGFCPSPFQGVEARVLNGGSMDLTMRRETLPQHDDVNNPENTFIAEVQAQAGNVLDLYLDDNKAPDGYRLIHSAGTFNLFREVMADTTPVDILDGNGNTGGNGTVAGGNVNGDNTTPPVVSTSGTITPSDTAPTLPVIVIP